MKRKKTQARSIVLADPSRWSEASQGSVSAHWTREYRDIEYSCLNCRAKAVFSDEDQKHTYEVKKASIDQQRILCTDCWKRSIVLIREIGSCEERWAESKADLQKDGEFLSKWLKLLEDRENYVRSRPNTAAKNMLRKLLHKLAEQAIPADRGERRRSR